MPGFFLAVKFPAHVLLWVCNYEALLDLAPHLPLCIPQVPLRLYLTFESEVTGMRRVTYCINKFLKKFSYYFKLREIKEASFPGEVAQCI